MNLKNITHWLMAFLVFGLMLTMWNLLANAVGGGYNKGIINQVLYSPDVLVGITKTS